MTTKKIIHDEAWIQHEVKIRLHKELMDEKFIHSEKRMDKMDAKLNSILTILISALLIPVGLKLLGFV